MLITLSVGSQEGPLAKFSAGYKKLFPYSYQIIVSTGADIVILPKFMLVSRLSHAPGIKSSDNPQKQRVQPVADLCQALGVTRAPPKEHRILTHVLSNGPFP